MKKTKTYRIISIVSGIIALVALIVLAVIFLQMRKAKLEHEQLLETVYIHTEATPEPTPEPTAAPQQAEPEVTPVPTPEPTPEPVVIPIDFNYLQNRNSDVDGWILVDGTDIDYPVLYDASDDLYYMDHTQTGAYAESGSIFFQDYNNRDFVDFNTVIYGHSMTDSVMFTHLHRFEQEDFFNAGHDITIYTENARLTYRVFAAYERDDAHILATYDFTTEEGRQEYLDEIYTHDGFFDTSVPVTPNDRIITLSTCTGYLYTRYIVQAVLVAEEAGVLPTAE